MPFSFADAWRFRETVAVTVNTSTVGCRIAQLHGRWIRKTGFQSTGFKMSRWLFSILVITAWLVGSSQTMAQDPCVQYQLVPRTIYEQKKVTTYREVMETQYQTQRTTSYKPVWTTERRENRYSVLKPVTETSFREERYTVLKPVTETGFREETFEETTWETITEMREEQVVEEKPIVETSFREEQVRVSKPVVETMMQEQNVTVYRPTTVNETQYVPGTTAVNSFNLAMTPGSTRLQWLQPGFRFDPVTGQNVWQRAGLHWVQSPATAYYVPQTTLMPTVTPQTVQRTSLVPETVVRKEPVQVTRYVDEIITRKVPVETRRTERQIITRKVPVQVQKPVKRLVTKRIPIERVTYERQEMVRKVPVTEQRFETVERVDYEDVQVCRWQEVESEVQVPLVVTRRIPVETTMSVPRTVMMRVPVDAFGNPIQLPNYFPAETTYSAPIGESAVISSRPLSSGSPASEDPVRVETARPAVEWKAVPGTARDVFNETQLKPETDLQKVTPRDNEHLGTVERAGDGSSSPAAADTRPALSEAGTSNAEKSGPENSEMEKQDGPTLDPPAQPSTDSSHSKPDDPVDN